MGLRVRIVGGTPVAQRQTMEQLRRQGHVEAADGDCDVVLVDLRAGIVEVQLPAMSAPAVGILDCGTSADVRRHMTAGIEGWISLADGPAQLEALLDRIVAARAPEVAIADEIAPEPDPDYAQHSVLLIEDDKLVRDIVRALIVRSGHECFEAETGRDGLALATVKAPHLIVLDRVLPDMDGLDLIKELAGGLTTRSIPVILLTARGETEERIRGLRAGADDYIVKPFKPAELLARVEAGLRRSRRDITTDPLTKLPGNAVLREELRRRVRGDSATAVVYVDINEFKAYVDHYGFERASLAIQRLAQVLYNAVVEVGAPEDLVGHIGGDDFLVVAGPDRAESLAEKILTAFGSIAPDLYDEADRERGFIEGHDRYEVARRFGLMSLSLAIIDIAAGTPVRMQELGAFASECKKLVKRVGGNASVRFPYVAGGDLA